MGCGTRNPDILTLTKDGITTLFSMSNPLVATSMKDPDGLIFSRDISDIPRKSITNIEELNALRNLDADLLFGRIHLPIHMYMCPRCNPFNQDYTRFIEIQLTVDEKSKMMYYEFGYFKSEAYKQIFFELNPERVLAAATL